MKKQDKMYWKCIIGGFIFGVIVMLQLSLAFYPKEIVIQKKADFVQTQEQFNKYCKCHASKDFAITNLTDGTMKYIDWDGFSTREDVWVGTYVRLENNTVIESYCISYSCARTISLDEEEEFRCL